VSKTTTLVYNQHLIIEAPGVKASELEQGSFFFKVMAQRMLSTEVIAQFKLD